MIRTIISKLFSFRLDPRLAVLLPVFSLVPLSAQPPLFRTYNYIETYSLQAVEQMTEHRIPASVILAQAILESRGGTSELAKRSNNHFGIKCHSEWTGDTIANDDDNDNECFRRYNSIAESYNDHSVFLISRPRYAQLFSLGINNYRGWCTGLKNAGYATSPRYADDLIKLIEDHKLYELDGSEKMEMKSGVRPQEQTLRVSGLDARRATLVQFSKLGVLFIDERDILVQSLNFIPLLD
jgi:hypothetical protein